jgi:N-acetylglucosamine-6-phosphate deacetylase
MRSVAALVVAGGRVLTPAGWVTLDVFVSSGRIVGVASNVRSTSWTVGGGQGRPTEVGTADAGAERAALRPFAVSNADTVARTEAPVAGGSPPSRPAPASGAPLLDAAGLLVVPGLVDLQCNGAVGVDISTEPERLWEVAAALPRWGVTAWLPTVVTGPPEIRHRALATLRPRPGGTSAPGAVPLGLHLEGPFLAPAQRGAHAAEHLRPPDPRVVIDEGWTRDAGVALVTLAPELPGALDVVRTLVAAGVVVSAGHSSASAAQSTAAIDAGVSWVTHLFNAMGPFHHRDPGLAGVALTDDRVRVGVIADGVHLHPATVALAARALGERLCLVTDAAAALGVAAGITAGTSGRVRLGEREAVADADSVRLADGTLAGSTQALDKAVRNLAAFAGVPLEAGIAAATAAPPAVLGLDDRGVIAPGAVADLVLLDPPGAVVATVVGGHVVYDRRSPPPVGQASQEGPWRS